MAIGSMLRQPMKTSYVDFYSLFNHPEKDWETLLGVSQKEDCQLSIFFDGAWNSKIKLDH